MEYYSVIKRNELWIHTTLNVSQIYGEGNKAIFKGYIQYNSITQYFQNDKIIKLKNRLTLARDSAWGEGKW